LGFECYERAGLAVQHSPYASGASWPAGADEFWASDNLSVSVTSVPEPSTYAMMLVGLGLVDTLTQDLKHATP